MTSRSFPEYVVNVQATEFIRTVLPKAVVFHVPNEGRRGRYEALRLQRMGVLPGVSDLILLVEGRFYALECKAPGSANRLTDAQEIFAESVRAAGGEFAVVTSIEDLRRALAGWGILTRESGR